MNEGDEGVGTGGEGELDGVCVELFPEGEVCGEARGVEEAGEGEGVEGDGVAEHLGEGGDGEGEVVVGEVGVDESVPCQCVPFGTFVEHLVGFWVE